MRKTCLFFLCITVCCGACSVLPEDPQQADFVLLTGCHFYTPCGQPRISAKLPEKDGYYLLYVLDDSLQIKDCMSLPQDDSLQVDFEKDFLLAAVVRETGQEWRFQLKNMQIVDSILFVHLDVHPYTEKVDAKPGYIWKINGEAVKLIKLSVDPDNYAWVHGPAWNETPVKLRQLRGTVE